MIESIYDQKELNLFGRVRWLTRLDLSYNPLRSTQLSDFDGMNRRLEHIDLSNGDDNPEKRRKISF